MKITDSPVAASVRAELAHRKISGRQLAEALDWTSAFTSRRLSGDVDFRSHELEAIAAHLGIEVSRFYESRP